MGAAGKQPGLPSCCGGEGTDPGQVGVIAQHARILRRRAQHAVIGVRISHGS